MSEAIDRDHVLRVVKEQIVEVMMDLAEDDIDPSKALKDYGANSLDRSEIALNAMDALGLSFPARELAQVNNIDGLVALLHDKLQGSG